MFSAAHPENEVKRMDRLQAFGILDTPPETCFDELAHLAVFISQSSRALICFIDGNRQWIKAKVGISVSELPRDQSFCAHTILQQTPLVVTDTRLDHRFKDSPIVMGAPHIRFYAGFPLLTKDQCVIGTLCVLDIEPKSLTKCQIDALELIARQVMDQLELHQARIKIDESSKFTELGEMVASIAHEINNPLAIIHGKASILIRKAEAGLCDLKTVTEYGSSIVSVVDRIGKIIFNLKSITKKSELSEIELISLRRLISGALALCENRIIKEEIDFRISDIPDSAVVRCNETQIIQVIVNLLNNAIESIHMDESPWIEIKITEGARYTSLRVVDSGEPVKPEIIKNMFTAFYTSKVKGTGLGLSISRDIMRLHHGNLYYETVEGRPSFVVEIPK